MTRFIDAYDAAMFDLDGVVYLGPRAVEDRLRNALPDQQHVRRAEQPRLAQHLGLMILADLETVALHLFFQRLLAGKDILIPINLAEPGRHLGASPLERRSGFGTQGVHGPCHVGVVLQVVGRYRVHHLARLVGGVGRIQVDQGVLPHSALQDGEVTTYRLDVQHQRRTAFRYLS